jgi:hypothetical protein
LKSKYWTTPIPHVMQALTDDFCSTGSAYWEVEDSYDQFRITRMNREDWYYKYG